MESKMPKEWRDVVNQLDSISKSLRKEIKSGKSQPVEEYTRMLNIATGCYMFLVPKFKKYRALKANNQAAKYCQIKDEWPSDEKFVSRMAEIEAEKSIAKVRAVRDFLEGWMLAAESAIYTLRKHLSLYSEEKKISISE